MTESPHTGITAGTGSYAHLRLCTT